MSAAVDSDLLVGFIAATAIALVTAPVGVSGAVFLLPVQLSVLHVPNPSVTPTNLLYNVVAGPGALARYRRLDSLDGVLTRLLLAGTLPGVVVGAVIRVHVVPGARPFRIVAAVVLFSIGVWLLRRTLGTPGRHTPLSNRRVVGISLAVGIVGGVYGIGGGSVLSPILVGSGLAVATVAPAALASTFVTSLVGAITYAVLALTASGSVAPQWTIGIACGLGGLIGGYAGALLQPRMPETFLRVLLGSLAVAVSVLYFGQAIS